MKKYLFGLFLLSACTAKKEEALEVLLTKGAINTVGTLFLTANASYLEVLTAQQNALRSELELLEISRKRWTHAIQLYRVLGGGW
jgi:hypothetical protein